MTLKPMFKCPTHLLRHYKCREDAADIALAVRITKEFLTTGELPVIIVRAGSGQTFDIQTNVMSFLVAHTLSIPTVNCQELCDE